MLFRSVAISFALTQGLLDDVPVEKVGAFETEFRKYFASSHPDLAAQITSGRVLTDEISEGLRGAVSTFKQTVPF